jgi:hypothetical protein
MPVVQLEHAVKDFAMWKAAFDRDPIDRRALGVRRHRIMRPVDDANYVMVELDFATTEQAEACRAALDRLWASHAAAPALLGTPHTRIVEAIEDRRY